MISKKTILVLGAGASMGYGFPSGQMLIDQICSGTQSSATQGSLFRTLLDAGFTENEIIAFGMALKQSPDPSIDQFLGHRREFLDIGKVAISACIIPCERREYFEDRNKFTESWYHYLWDQLQYTRDLLHQNNLSIITFNYDRSLEYFLAASATNRYDCPAAGNEILKAIPIIHVHGQLGHLEWGDTPNARPYVPTILRGDIRKVAGGIRITSESELDVSPNFVDVQRLISQTEVICFLGFGYHQDNLRRLGLSSIIQNQDVLGTCYNLKHQEFKQIQARISRWNTRNYGGSPMHIEAPPLKIREFLRHTGILS